MELTKTRQQLNTLVKKQDREIQKLRRREEEEQEHLARWEGKIAEWAQSGKQRRAQMAQDTEMPRVQKKLDSIRVTLFELEEENVKSKSEYDKITRYLNEFKGLEKHKKRLKSLKMKEKVKEVKQLKKVGSFKEGLREAEAELERNPHKKRLQVGVRMANKKVVEQETKLQEIQDEIQEIRDLVVATRKKQEELHRNHNIQKVDGTSDDDSGDDSGDDSDDVSDDVSGDVSGDDSDDVSETPDDKNKKDIAQRYLPPSNLSTERAIELNRIIFEPEMSQRDQDFFECW